MKIVSDEDENQFQCLAGESQPLDDISIEDIFNTMKENITKSVKGQRRMLHFRQRQGMRTTR